MSGSACSKECCALEEFQGARLENITDTAQIERLMKQSIAALCKHHQAAIEKLDRNYILVRIIQHTDVFDQKYQAWRKIPKSEPLMQKVVGNYQDARLAAVLVTYGKEGKLQSKMVCII